MQGLKYYVVSTEQTIKPRLLLYHENSVPALNLNMQ